MTPETPEFNPSLVRGRSLPPKEKPVRTGHRIADVHWPPGVKPEEYDACPLECTCGWSGTVGEWPEHRGKKAVASWPGPPVQW